MSLTMLKKPRTNRLCFVNTILLSYLRLETQYYYFKHLRAAKLSPHKSWQFQLAVHPSGGRPPPGTPDEAVVSLFPTQGTPQS